MTIFVWHFVVSFIANPFEPHDDRQVHSWHHPWLQPRLLLGHLFWHLPTWLQRRRLWQHHRLLQQPLLWRRVLFMIFIDCDGCEGYASDFFRMIHMYSTEVVYIMDMARHGNAWKGKIQMRFVIQTHRKKTPVSKTISPRSDANLLWWWTALLLLWWSRCRCRGRGCCSFCGWFLVGG